MGAEKTLGSPISDEGAFDILNMLAVSHEDNVIEHAVVLYSTIDKDGAYFHLTPLTNLPSETLGAFLDDFQRSREVG